MINKELIYVIQQIGNEKGIGVEVLFDALESALLSASKKTMGVADNVRMHLDRHTGALQVFARKKVVDAVGDPKLESRLAEARALNAAAELDDEIEVELAPQEFGRIAAQTAKQVILQRVRDAERDAIYSDFIDKEGKIVRGVVHRIEKRNVIVELGKAEGVITEREQIPGVLEPHLVDQLEHLAGRERRHGSGRIIGGDQRVDPGVPARSRQLGAQASQRSTRGNVAVGHGAMVRHD